MLPLKESSRDLILEVAATLRPFLDDITETWWEKLAAEFQFEPRVLAALKRLTLANGRSYFSGDDFADFFENVTYHSARLAKLQVDTRDIARSLELYQTICEPYIEKLFGERREQATSAVEMLSSATFVCVSGAYFDAQRAESAALLSVLDAELSAGNLSTLLECVLRTITSIFHASMGVVLLREPESDLLRVKSAVGFDGRLGEEVSISIGQGFAGKIAQTGEPAMLPDVSPSEMITNPLVRGKAKALWGVPLTSEGVVGVLLIGFDWPYEWLPRERELLCAIAERSALAIERARMTDALREREARIAELSGYLLRVQEEERKRISRELHDETGQALMVIRLYLGMLETSVAARAGRAKIRETLEVVDRTIEGIRRIIARLSPLVLQELGLIAAIRKEAKDLARSTGVRARVVVADNVGRLTPQLEMALYRSVQEALHNVAKHAHASNVSIIMTRETNEIRLLVQDDGMGIVAKQKNNAGQSFGLAGMKERISTLGGKVLVTSGKGKGTRIEIEVPAAAASTGQQLSIQSHNLAPLTSPVAQQTSPNAAEAKLTEVPTSELAIAIAEKSMQDGTHAKD